MNTKLYNKLSVIALAAVLVACSATSADKDKKARLEKLKTEQAALQKEIKKLEEEIGKENPQAAVVKAKEVVVKELQPSKFEHFVQTQGMIESNENIQVSTKMPGVVTEVFVQEGQEVRRGQTLAQVDNSLIIRNIEELKASLDLAKTVYDRQKNLWDQKIGTEVQYLQAKNNKESLEKRLAALNEQNDQTRIKSPINGVVDQVTVKIGQNIMPGAPAVRVVNNSDLKVKAQVSEAYVLNIKKGDKVIVTVPDLKRDIEAKVTFVGRSIDQLSRTFAVEAKVSGNNDLRANMSVVLKVVYQSFPNALTVPVNVVQEVNNEKVVYVAQERDGHIVAAKKEVVVDGVFDGRAQVQGLSTGDKIITVGYQGLSDGTVIKI
ncbi:efflux RND transporter periplasmic adaptor subunit [Chryseolinea sp. T2]|uniref:efflux RND transporter periplasmic adaptor subunit n=1 Tax=Chryseolinea sp. T2 TaxID=3129255 RepID=UPI003076F9EB